MEKGRVVFKLRGADHTFCNALKEELWEDKDVSVSAYNIRHPLTGTPQFVVESSGDVTVALKKAVKRLQKRNKEFLTLTKSL